jgi:hypothetical protein
VSAGVCGCGHYTAVGASALATNSAGTNPTAVGRLALTTNSTGANTAVGARSIKVDNGGNNTAVGAAALLAMQLAIQRSFGSTYASVSNLSRHRLNNTGSGALLKTPPPQQHCCRTIRCDFDGSTDAQDG